MTNAKIMETLLKDRQIKRSEAIRILGELILWTDEFVGIGIMMEQDIFDEEEGYDLGDRFFNPYVFMESKTHYDFKSVGTYDDYANEDYFKIPKASGKLYITDPYLYEVNGKEILMVTICAPIFYDGKFAGVVGHDIDVKFFKEHLSNIKIFENGFLSLISSNQYLAYYPDTDYDIGLPLSESSWKDYPEDLEAIDNAINKNQIQMIKSRDDDIGAELYCYYIPFEFVGSDKPWIIGTSVFPSEANAAINWGILIGILLSVVAVILSLVALVFIISRKIKPLSRIAGIVSKMVETGDMSVNLTSNDIANDEIGLVTTSFIKLTDMMNGWIGTMKNVALGDFSESITERSDKDEFSKNMNFMIESNKNYVKSISDVMSEFSSGNLSAKINMEYHGDFAPIKNSINETMHKVKGYIDEISKILYKLKSGILSEYIENDFVGDFNDLKVSVNQMIDGQRSYVSEISRVMSEMKEGYLDVSIDTDFHGDFEPIKISVNETINFLKTYISEITRIFGMLADKDLTGKLNIKFKGDFKVLEESLAKIVDSLNQTLTEIKGATVQVSSGAEQISYGSQVISKGAVDQNSLLEDLSNATVQIVNKSKINSENAKAAVKISNEAISEVVRSNEKMQKLVEAMDEINIASEQISKIIKTIEDIAFQTNLLSLNASIEAARAGQYGKGFSVVAEEVRLLASRSSNAVKNTSELIQKSVEAVRHGSELTNDTASSLNQVVAKTKKAGDLVVEIVTSTDEQLSGTNSINNGIEQILGVVQSNSAAAQEAAASGEELFAQAEALNGLVGKFKV